MAHAFPGFLSGAGADHFLIVPKRAIEKQQIRICHAVAQAVGDARAAGDIVGDLFAAVPNIMDVVS